MKFLILYARGFKKKLFCAQTSGSSGIEERKSVELLPRCEIDFIRMDAVGSFFFFQ